MNVLLIVSAILISLILTEISWRLIESPAQNLRRWLMRGKEDDTRAHPSEEMLITQLAEQNRLRSETVHPASLSEGISLVEEK
jgi:peptidoglycan/LPS O-acetylase OafA/YrhL